MACLIRLRDLIRAPYPAERAAAPVAFLVCVQHGFAMPYRSFCKPTNARRHVLIGANTPAGGDPTGPSTLAGVTVTVLGEFKLEPFQVAFEDLNIGTAGLPVRVIRSYDSLKRQTALDFGWGWSVDYQSTSLRKNMTFGLAREITNIFTQVELCLRPAGQRKIAVTLPDGKVERFIAYNDSECAAFQVSDLNLRFAGLTQICL
jgi:hypothetical protein